MDRTQSAIVALLKSAITGKGQPLPEDFELEKVLQTARKHQIVAMVYQGAVLCGVDAGKPEMQQMFQLYCRSLQHSEAQMAWVEKIFRGFQEAGIEHLPVKGCRLKKLYPKPEMRTMGDADILIRMEQYEKVTAVMTALGFEADGESDHELKWKAPGLNVELHKRLIPSYNKDYFAYYGDGWQLAKEKIGSQYAMTKENEFVYIFAHFAKHFRDGGAGYRYITDLWVYRRKNPNLDQTYITGELEKLQMADFYRNILRLIACWFEDGPADGVLELMTQYIDSGGTWGDLESKVLSVTVRDSKRASQGIWGRIAFLRRIAFPNFSSMQLEYPILKKMPWLLPVMWIRRGFRKVFLERGTVARKKKELQILDKKNLQEREEFLKVVGLEYNF